VGADMDSIYVTTMFRGALEGKLQEKEGQLRGTSFSAAVEEEKSVGRKR